MSAGKKPKLLKLDNGRLFSKSRREEAERLARAERRAASQVVEAAEKALVYKAAVHEEEESWTEDKSHKTEAARLAAEEAASWERATAEAVRSARAQFNAREDAYTKAENTVANAFKKLTKKMRPPEIVLNCASPESCFSADSAITGDSLPVISQPSGDSKDTRNSKPR